jgi:hypothetical protein
MWSASSRLPINGLLLAGWLLPSCGNDTCPSANPGDKFEITVNGIRAGNTPCAALHLDPGVKFTMTVARPAHQDQSGVCVGPYAEPNVPSFARGFLTRCLADRFPLGLECNGTYTDGVSVACDIEVGFQASPLPSKVGDVIEHSVITASAQGDCLSWECGGNIYDVRIEKLPPGSDAGE